MSLVLLEFNQVFLFYIDIENTHKLAPKHTEGRHISPKLPFKIPELQLSKETEAPKTKRTGLCTDQFQVLEINREEIPQPNHKMFNQVLFWCCSHRLVLFSCCKLNNAHVTKLKCLVHLSHLIHHLQFWKETKRTFCCGHQSVHIPDQNQNNQTHTEANNTVSTTNPDPPQGYWQVFQQQTYSLTLWPLRPCTPQQQTTCCLSEIII